MDNRARQESPVTIEGSTMELLPAPREIRLKTQDDVRLELSRVYRDMRAARIDTADGTKLAYVLDAVRKSIETSQLADRLEMIELTLNGRKMTK